MLTVNLASPIRVLLCDDHPVVRKGLSALVNGADGMEVIASAADGEEAIALAVAQNPDVIVMDISMPGMDGLEATRRIIRALPGARVVMLTSFSDRAREARESGAIGYILKDYEPRRMISDIREAATVQREAPPPAA